MSTVMEQIRKLDEEKNKLLHAAKQESLDIIHAAMKTLSELGFHHKLVEVSTPSKDPVVGAAATGTSTRRTGIRDDVLKAVKAFPKITRAELLVKMEVKGDKSGEQSVSNALAALKKAGTIEAVDGAYTAV